MALNVYLREQLDANELNGKADDLAWTLDSRILERGAFGREKQKQDPQLHRGGAPGQWEVARGV